jgi:hypothetical protein
MCKMHLMRFSLATLLLIFPAFCIAYLVSRVWYAGYPTYDFEIARKDIHRHYLTIAVADQGDRLFTRQLLSVDDLNKWFAGKLDRRHPLVERLGVPPDYDPWASPYRCVRDVTLPNGETVKLGVYSSGSDRVSRTGGHDSDDLNSWSDGAYHRYLDDAEARKRGRCVRLSCFLLPFSFLGLLTLTKIISTAVRPRQSTAQLCNEKEGSDHSC